MRHVRRKILKRKVKKTKYTPSSTDLQKQLPQHVLDQIPSGTSLRPSLSSMRQLMAQKMATPVLPLPFNLTPQQQQVQNMRSSNDLKEEAINQAKQDMINENERKRSLQKKEVDVKRENQLIKHALDSEKQQFDQSQKLAEESHKLKLQGKEIEFKKKLLDGDNAIHTQRIKNEQQLALIEQAKYENEKLKQQYNTNDLNNRFKKSKNEFDDITAQNTALENAIKKLGSEDFVKGYNELISNLTEAKARNHILMSLKEQQQKLAEEHVLSMITPTNEQLDAQYETMKGDIQGLQASLADQIKLKQEAQEKMDKINNVREYRTKLVLMTDNMTNEADELKTLSEKIGTIDDDVKKAITAKVNAEAKRDIEKQKVDIKRKEEEAYIENNMARERQMVMYTDDYKKQLATIASAAIAVDQLKEESKRWNDSLKASDEAHRLESENEIKQLVLNAKINGQDPLDVLRGQFEAYPESPTKATNIHNQLAAQTQLATQEMTEQAEIITQFIAMVDSVGGQGDNIRAFMEAKGVSKDQLLTLLKESPLEQARDIVNDYLQGPQEE